MIWFDCADNYNIIFCDQKINKRSIGLASNLPDPKVIVLLVKRGQKPYNSRQRSREMSGKSSFPYRKYDRKPHPHIVKQILEDYELIEMMKEVLIHEGRPCPFCHRKLKGEGKEKEIWE